MMHRYLRLGLAPALAAAGVALLASPEARANGVTLHAEQDFAFLTNGGSNVGFGFSGRMGYRFELGPIWLAPELGGGYISFRDIGGYSLHPARIFGGGRLGLRGFVQPQIYGHAGYGWLGGLGDINLNGAMFEVGVALDLRVLPILGIGIHGGYTSNENINGDAVGRDAFNWVNVGAHVGLTF
jgi:hypothetical protein